MPRAWAQVQPLVGEIRFFKPWDAARKRAKDLNRHFSIEDMRVCSVVQLSDSLWPLATRLFCSWNFPGKNTRVGYRFLLQGSSQHRDRNQVSCTSCTGEQVLYHCTTWAAPQKTHPCPATTSGRQSRLECGGTGSYTRLAGCGTACPLRKDSLVVLQKADQWSIIQPANSTPRYILKRTANGSLNRDLDTRFHCSISHYSPKVKIFQVPINRWVDKQMWYIHKMEYYSAM